MPRLAGADAGFVYAESPTQPSTLLLVLSAEVGDRPLTIDDLRAQLAERIALAPVLRQRLERVPGGLAHPVLVDDPDFDLDYHLRHVALPAGGVDVLAAEAAATHLDRRHPLWRMVLVDEPVDGRQVVLVLLHHAIADGTAIGAMLHRLFGRPAPGEAERWAEPFRPAPVRPWRLALAALGTLWRSLLALPGRVKAVLDGIGRVKERRASSAVAVPEQADTPRTTLNDAFGPERRVATVSLPVPTLRAVAAAAGTTVNDVLLACVAGALVQHLGPDLPRAPLTADVPVSTEPDGPGDRYWGNRFSNLLTSLCTDVPDPWDRLGAIAAVSAEAKAQLVAFGPTALREVLDVLPGFLAEPGARALARQKRRERKAESSVLVSNIRGDDEPLSVAEAPIASVHVVGPAFDGTGLTVLGYTRGDVMGVGVLAEATAVPDPGRVAAALADALEVLAVAAHDRKEDPHATPVR